MRGIEDERQVHIYLTDAGRELKKAIHDIPGVIYCAAGSDADRLIKLRDDLVRLRASLIEYNETWNLPIVTINHSYLDVIFAQVIIAIYLIPLAPHNLT